MAKRVSTSLANTAGAKTAENETWILNAHIMTQNENRDAFHGHIRVLDGKIAEISRRLPTKISKKTSQFDATGSVVLPGFVQAHVHLCQTLFRNLADDLELLDWLQKRIWPMEAAHTAETLRTSALLGIHELLSTGTTCVLDMGTVRHTEQIFQAVKSSGIRANVGKCLMDNPDTVPPGLYEPTHQAMTEAKFLFDKWNHAENDRIRVSYAPRFAISCTKDLLRQVAELSERQGALVHTHASENRKEIELVKKLFGQDNIQCLADLGLTSSRLVLAHCVWLSKAEMRLLQRTKTNVAHCPSSNLKLASGLAPIPELRKMGINVALGADGAPCNNHLDMFQEMRLAALLHKPGRGPTTIRAQEALDMATRDGAKALSWNDKIGSIEVGKQADLIAVDVSQPENFLPFKGQDFSIKNFRPTGRSFLNSTTPSTHLSSELIASTLVYSSQSAHLKATWVNGKILYSRGKVTTISRSAILKQARSAQEKIMSNLLR